MLGSSPWRRRRGAEALAATGAVTEECLVDGGPGVRLQGFLSTIPGVEPRGLALLLHGWEGSAESSYMRQAAAQFLLRVYLEKQDPKYRPGLERAVSFVLDSQYPIGGWPQRFPINREYSNGGLPDYTANITFSNEGNTLRGS